MFAEEQTASTITLVASVIIALAGGLYGIWERWNKQKATDAAVKNAADNAKELAELTRRAAEDEEARKRTAAWIAMHVAERDRALQRLEEQQKAHMLAIEQAAAKTAECNALLREKEAVERKLAECEKREQAHP